MTDNRKFWIALWTGMILTIITLTTIIVVSKSIETKRYLDKGWKLSCTKGELK